MINKKLMSYIATLTDISILTATIKSKAIPVTGRGGLYGCEM
jgi:hypothetical protein